MYIGLVLVLVSCFLFLLRSSLFSVSWPLSSKSCLCIFHMFVRLFGLWLLSQYLFYLVYCCVLLCLWLWLWLSGFGLSFHVLADNSLAFRLGTVCYLMTWLMTPVSLLTSISACCIKPLIFCTLCIWVPHSLSLPTPYITLSVLIVLKIQPFKPFFK